MHLNCRLSLLSIGPVENFVVRHLSNTPLFLRVCCKNLLNNTGKFARNEQFIFFPTVFYLSGELSAVFKKKKRKMSSAKSFSLEVSKTFCLAQIQEIILPTDSTQSLYEAFSSVLIAVRLFSQSVCSKKKMLK